MVWRRSRARVVRWALMVGRWDARFAWLSTRSMIRLSRHVMAKRTVITREFYDNVCAIYREVGINHVEVARRALCIDRTVSKLYHFGSPRLGFPPIRQVLDSTQKTDIAAAQQAARDAAKRAQEAADAERAREEKERRDAADQERQMLKVARGDVLSCLVIAAELTPAMRILARVITKACELDEKTGELPAIAPAAAMALLVRHALVMQRAINATEAIVQLSRLDRGETTANVGVGPAAGLSLEDALTELEALGQVTSAVRRVHALGPAGSSSSPAGVGGAGTPGPNGTGT